MPDRYVAYYDSPVGVIEVCTSKKSVLRIEFVDEKKQVNQELPSILTKALDQLDQYFKGERQQFDLPVEFEGTEFQKKVWNGLLTIPFGEVWSYKDLAVEIGNEKAVRAVGNANRNNPISIIIPCHRVIGANGTLTGYAGGLHRKEWLLDHEKGQYHLIEL
ncbi:methylated-DNA--[protein]-cysteine S-methyltransferase [Bacillus solimangrovi]|uniref:Methylated-DNA--protein-cysteine methyltransferase n=1 Tax=Bacillus solimangrovi TaxID=1305675 RepID=A0A1E5LGS0_9BACI|nr:methylated-DNA--[protein]-cysteine S-methyltransferase [Bacillus solimangrovi]OEH93264.1 cysteine methyltransferase [Bacillus solimangrovi]